MNRVPSLTMGIEAWFPTSNTATLEILISPTKGQRGTPKINTTTGASYTTDVTPTAITRPCSTNMRKKSGLLYRAPSICNGRRLPDYAKTGNRLQVQNSNLDGSRHSTLPDRRCRSNTGCSISTSTIQLRLQLHHQLQHHHLHPRHSRVGQD